MDYIKIVDIIHSLNEMKKEIHELSFYIKSYQNTIQHTDCRYALSFIKNIRELYKSWMKRRAQLRREYHKQLQKLQRAKEQKPENSALINFLFMNTELLKNHVEQSVSNIMRTLYDVSEK